MEVNFLQNHRGSVLKADFRFTFIGLYNYFTAHGYLQKVTVLYSVKWNSLIFISFVEHKRRILHACLIPFDTPYLSRTNEMRTWHTVIENNKS